jgi:hypothetical protein
VSLLLVGALMYDALGHDRTLPQIRTTVVATIETLLAGLSAQQATGGDPRTARVDGSEPRTVVTERGRLL